MACSLSRSRPYSSFEGTALSGDSPAVGLSLATPLRHLRVLCRILLVAKGVSSPRYVMSSDWNSEWRCQSGNDHVAGLQASPVEKKASLPQLLREG